MTRPNSRSALCAGWSPIVWTISSVGPLIVVLILFRPVVCRADPPALPHVGGAVAADVADLQDQLENGLRVRLPREFAFVARVVELVRSGKLPAEMVTTTYSWARLKHPRPYPYPYFEAALKMRAHEAGIEL